MRETVGIVVFSGFMVLVVGMVVGNVLLALWRERRQRKAGVEPRGPALED